MNEDSMMDLFGKNMQQNTLGEVPPMQYFPVASGDVQAMVPEGSTWVHEHLPYLNSFLSSQVGKNVNVGYIFGTGQTVERRGKLVGVGYNYIILQEEFTNHYIACDFYSIKFVRILNEE